MALHPREIGGLPRALGLITSRRLTQRIELALQLRLADAGMLGDERVIGSELLRLGERLRRRGLQLAMRLLEVRELGAQPLGLLRAAGLLGLECRP